MNTILRVFKYNTSLKNAYQHLRRPVFTTQYAKVNKVRLCNFQNKTSNTKLQQICLCASILTWLGFEKDDEEKESELIMTIKRAILLTQRGELPKAEQMLHVALKLAQDQQNQQGVLYIYDLMANLALERGEADKAQTLFVIVLQTLLAQGMKHDDIKVIHISLKLARIYQMKGDIEKAETGFKWCLDSIRKKQTEIHDTNVIALKGVTQDWYAQLLMDKGRINESLEHLKDAHKICTEIEGEDSEKSVLLLNDLGTATWRLGDLQTAQEYLNRAVKLGKNIDDFGHLGVIYANLGLVSLQKGVLSEAMKYCKEGWRLGKKQNNSDAVEQANYCFEQIKSQS